MAFIEEDKVMHDEIERSVKFIQKVEIVLPDALLPGL